MKKTWQIDKNASDWECDPKSEELFHLRYFRSLPMEKKIQAVRPKPTSHRQCRVIATTAISEEIYKGTLELN